MATKKISELPLVNAVSGSQVAGGSVIPIVIGTGIQGTTNQISVENFSKFVNAYNATTSSNTFIGTQTINGNVSISGRLTVNEVVAQYETASILFSTGSTKLGDQLTDKHEFTGSTNITGSILVNGNLLLNGASLNNSFERIHQTTGSLQQATASLQFHSASVEAQLLRLQQTTQSLQVATASLQFHSASVDAQLQRLQQTTQSLHVATASLNNFTASQDARNFVIALYTASLEAQLERVYQTTQSLHVATASLEFHSASVDAQLLAIQQTTQSLHVATASLNAFSASTNAHIVGISDFTSSQLAVNLGNAIYTASVDSHIVGISTYTSSVRDTLARVHQTTQSLQVATASLQQFTASQDARNFVVSQVTASLIGITNGLMAFTAALDNTYATDAQLYELYQATRSLELHSGSMIGVTNGLMAYTASNNTLNTGLRDEVSGVEEYTASLKAAAIVSSSTQISNYHTFAQTSSANIFYNNQTISGSLKVRDGVTGSFLGNLNGTATNASNLVVQNSSTNQNYAIIFTTAGVNGNLTGYTDPAGGMLYNPSTNKLTVSGSVEISGSINVYGGTITGSILATNGVISGSVQLPEIAGIEAYTASLKAQSIVSSSTQIQNYDVFALNSNLYESTGSIKAEIAGIEAYTASLKGAIVVSGTNVEVLGTLTAQEIYTTYVTSSVMYQSGSTKFGDTQDDKHQITGSLLVTGSLTTGDITIQNTGALSIFKLKNSNSTTGLWLYSNGLNATLSNQDNGNVSIETAGTERVSVDTIGGVNFNGAITASVIKGTKITTPTGLEYQVRNTNGASGDHIFKSYNTNILKLDGGSNKSSFGGDVDVTGSLKLSTSLAGYAATFTNVNDGSEGILVRTTDNDTTQYIAKFQSSGTAVSETYIDRLLLTKDGTLTASGSVKVQNDITVGNSKQFTNNLGISAGVTTTIVTLPNMGSSAGLVLVMGDNGSYGFADLVIGGFTTAVVMNSTTIYGSPPARTYSRVNNDLQLNIGTATTIRVSVLSGLFT